MKKILLIVLGIFSLNAFTQNEIQLNEPWPYLVQGESGAVLKSVYADYGSPSFFVAGYVIESGEKNIYVSALEITGGTIPSKGGSFLWEKTLVLPGNQVANCISDNFIMAKGLEKLIVGYSDNDAFAVRIDNDGFGFSTPYTYSSAFGPSELKHAYLTTNDFVIATGYTAGESTGKDLLCVFLLDYGSGPFDYYTPIVFEGTGDDIGNAVTQTDNGLVIAGSTTSYGEGGKDGFIYGLDGEVFQYEWDTTFGTSADEEFFSITHNYLTNDFVAAGYTNQTGNKDFYLVGYNYINNTYWITTAGGLGDEEAYSIEIVTGGMGEGYLLATGYSTSFGTDTSIYVVKLDFDGNILWEGYYDQAGAQISYSSKMVDCEIVFAGSNYNTVDSQNDGLVFGIPVIDVMKEIHPVTCFGNENGEVMVSFVGTSMSLNYSWFNDLENEIANNEDSIYGLIPGWYFIDGFDMYAAPEGCIFRDSILMTEPNVLISSIDWADVSCTGISDGWATIIGEGGTLPYSYLWSDFSVGDTAFNLTEDIMYNVLLTDVNGCETFQEVTISKLGLAAIYGIIGTPTSGDITDGLASAELFKINGLGNAELVTTSSVYSMGFDFIDMEPGSYLVRIAIDPSLQPGLMNTYYDTQYNWENAILLEADCDVIFEDVVVTLIESEVDFTGDGRFAGTVRMITTGAKDFGEPVPGAEIYLEQEPEGEPIASSESDENGEYDFEGLLTNRSYSLSVDIPGFPLIQTYSNIYISDTDTVFEELDFFVDTTEGSEGIYIEDPLNLPSAEMKSFSVRTSPNPFTDNLELAYFLKESSNVMVQVYDVRGLIVYSKSETTQEEGEHSLIITNVDIPETGNYYICLKVNRNVYLKKIVKL